MKKSHQWDVMSILIVRCPHCGKEIRSIGSDSWVGDKIICKKCNRKFELGAIKT